MKSHHPVLLLLCLISVSLPARADTAAARPTTEAQPVAPAPQANAVVPTAAVKPAAPAATKPEAPAAAEKPESLGTMGAVQVNGLADFRRSAPAVSDLRSEQKAALTLRLSDDAAKPSLAVSLPIERPTLAAPKVPTAGDNKNLASVRPSK